MGMFNLGSTTGLAEGGKFLSAGIHNAKFNGLALSEVTSQKDGTVYNTMQLTLDVEGYGDFVQNFFDPSKRNGVDDPTCMERTQSTYGENPSRVEHFMVALRQILDALDPKIGEDIDNKNVVINGKKINTDDLNFDQLVKLCAILTKPYIGAEVEVKLIPQNNGFNSIPSFPAKINRAGALGIATRFIGHDLTLSQREQKMIEQAQNNRPTNMAAPTSNVTLDGVAEALKVDTTTDLPF